MPNAKLSCVLLAGACFAITSTIARADEKPLEQALPSGSLVVVNKKIDVRPYYKKFTPGLSCPNGAASWIVFQGGRLMPPCTPYPLNLKAKAGEKKFTPACVLKPGPGVTDGNGVIAEHFVTDIGKARSASYKDADGKPFASSGALIIADTISTIECYSAEGDATYGREDLQAALGDYISAVPPSEITDALKKRLAEQQGKSPSGSEDATAKPKSVQKTPAAKAAGTKKAGPVTHQPTQ